MRDANEKLSISIEARCPSCYARRAAEASVRLSHANYRIEHIAEGFVGTPIGGKDWIEVRGSPRQMIEDRCWMIVARMFDVTRAREQHCQSGDDEFRHR